MSKDVPVDIGAMFHVVEIHAATNGNANGVISTQWTKVASVKGKWTPLQGRVLERAKSFGATINTTVQIRYLRSPIIDPVKSSLYLPALNKRLVGPVAINDQGQFRTMTIYCTEEF